MSKRYEEIKKDGYVLVQNPGGATLGYSPESGVGILEEEGLAFKDLNRDGKLDVYEDWRQPPEARAKDLAAQLSIEEIAGLMLYSAHQAVPGYGKGPRARFAGTYGGRPYEESGAKPYDLTDQQIAFLKDDHLRHVLVTTVESSETAAKWNNRVQALTEGIGHGIPANNSSDPRHGSETAAEFAVGAKGDISRWPQGIGMSATFDPALNLKFAQIAAREYRALGIATALSPQIDLSTEPRWMRFPGTFGEHTLLSTEMARTYCDGLQESEGEREIQDGWGYDSVNAMVKHWPGGGSGEGGRDAHYNYGKFAVYPGGNFEEHQKPFTEGAFRLAGKTGCASAVMPYYTVSHDIDQTNGENVGNSYSKAIITDLLREKYGYQGVVCTDWGITADEGPEVATFSGKCWGVENLSVAERHLKILLAGVDQFGGNNDAGPILGAYRLGCERYGEAAMRERFEASARRLLLNIFRVGLFENPYLDPAESAKIVGCPEFMQAGFEAQLKSLTLLKNKGNVLPLGEKAKVYIPNRHIGPMLTFFSTKSEPREFSPVKPELVNRYFELVDTPEEADVALVFMESPLSNGYDPDDAKAGGNGYLPISLQYRPYTAKNAREQSLAGGDPLENFTNRSYRGKTGTAANEADLDNVLAMRKAMGNKPVIVSIRLNNPTVMAEFEPYADAILADYGVQGEAIFETLCGKNEPSGLLPMQIPQDMETVEAQQEDVGLDMEPYVDSCGNCYDFAFGCNFHGVIHDGRTEKYGRKK